MTTTPNHFEINACHIHINAELGVIVHVGINSLCQQIAELTDALRPDSPANAPINGAALRDLRNRLFEKAVMLRTAADKTGTAHEVSRLSGKADGVTLAISFLDELIQGVTS